ncbi:calphotin-like isoform X2 [Schistocerca gregaria]|uniref:calphotin-like isoform X2 n=1 Tax=Schistocerca gregaria TaxID=7010 RepID=UPI00211DF70D|nr:calphotin-like isoform X2 [Schistocerca gregaria]
MTNLKKQILCGLLLVVLSTLCFAHNSNSGQEFFFRSLVNHFPQLQDQGWTYDNVGNYCNLNGVVCNEDNQVREIYLNVDKLKNSSGFIKNVCQSAKNEISKAYRNSKRAGHPHLNIDVQDEMVMNLLQYCNFIPSIEKLVIYDNNDQLECYNEGFNGLRFPCYISGNSMPECNDHDCKIYFRSRPNQDAVIKASSKFYDLSDVGTPVTLSAVNQNSNINTTPVELKRVEPPPQDTVPLSLTRVPFQEIQTATTNTATVETTFVPVGFQTVQVPVAQAVVPVTQADVIPATPVDVVPVEVIPVVPIAPVAPPVEPVVIEPIPQEPIPQAIPVAPVPQEPISQTIPVAPVPQEPISQTVPVAPVPQEPLPQVVPIAPVPQEPLPQVVPVAPVPQEPIPQVVPVAPVPQEPLPQVVPIAPVPQEPIPQVIPVAPVPQEPIPQVIPVAPVPQEPIPQAIPVEPIKPEAIHINPISIEIIPSPVNEEPIVIDAIPIDIVPVQQVVEPVVQPVVQPVVEPIVQPVETAVTQVPQANPVVLASSAISTNIGLLSYSIWPMIIASFIINFESVSSIMQ